MPNIGSKIFESIKKYKETPIGLPKTPIKIKSKCFLGRYLKFVAAKKKSIKIPIIRQNGKNSFTGKNKLPTDRENNIKPNPNADCIKADIKIITNNSILNDILSHRATESPFHLC